MRDSDRYVTPRVIVALVVTAGLLVALTIAAVTYLQSIGRDPEPMLKLAGLAVTGVASIGGFVLQLVNRTTIAKVERETGRQANEMGSMADAMYQVADALPRPVPRHAAGPSTVVADMGTAPTPRGE